MRRPFPLKVLLPLALGVIVSIAVLVFSEFGYRRLDEANRRTTSALEMQTKVNDVMALITDAETGQRGYLLTGDTSYLDPYKVATSRIIPTLSELREVVTREGSQKQQERLTRLNNLVGQRLNELETTLLLNEKNGREAAFQLIDTGIGKQTMAEIRTEIASLTNDLRTSLSIGTTRWRQDIEFARFGMVTMTGFTVALLLVVWFLARRELGLRLEQQRRALEESARLEQEVTTRTTELSELSNYLQTVREEEKSRLAREIHDELGGILVGAKMDVAWAKDHQSTKDPAVANKLERALRMLDEGVDIKRRVIEDLRPTLLDNLGLGAALDWLVRGTCERAGLACQVNLDEGADELPPEQSIAIYRIVQEALTNVLKYAKAKQVTVDVVLSPGGVSLSFADDGVGLPEDALSNHLSHGIAGIRQRVRALHGDFAIARRPEGGTMIEVNVPIGAEAATVPEPALA